MKVTGGSATPVYIFAIKNEAGQDILTFLPNTGLPALRVMSGPTDPISDVPVMIEFEHHQVHEGETHEFVYLISSLASGLSVDFRINVPSFASAVWGPHLISEIVSTGETETYLYEGMTYAVGNGGTLQTSFNRNRNSATVPSTKVYLSPTPAATGTNIWIGLTGSGKSAGGDRSLNEWILKSGTDYLLRVTSRATGDKILVRLNWYEDLGV